MSNALTFFFTTHQVISPAYTSSFCRSVKKMILFLVVFSLALSGGQGAPSTAVYKFVKCNPDGDQANCITHQSANMEWSPDLPTKLPSSAAQYLEAQPEEDEQDPEDEDTVEEESLSSEDESPVVYLSEDGSGDDGSGFMADRPTLAEDGSGELLDKNYKPKKVAVKIVNGLF